MVADKDAQNAPKKINKLKKMLMFRYNKTFIEEKN